MKTSNSNVPAGIKEGASVRVRPTGRKAGGQDLDNDDAWTGHVREISTRTGEAVVFLPGQGHVSRGIGTIGLMVSWANLEVLPDQARLAA